MTQIGAGQERVADVIRAQGPIGFDELMDLALYDPDHGFYPRGGGAGRRRDFLTSPEVGPLFGAVVARALDAWWKELGRPEPFVVIDAGAGPGTLARSIKAAEPACAGALRLVSVEVSRALRKAHPDEVASRPDLPVRGELCDGPVIILANELLDNLPFRLADRSDDTWFEIKVGIGGERLVEQRAALPPTEVERCDELAPSADEGARIPLQERAATWLRDALAVAAGGRVVVFDYASPTTALLAARSRTEWLRTFAAHGRGGHPLEAIGSQDITAEVAIDQLAGVRPPDVERSQAEFLQAHGIDALVAEGRQIWQERAQVGDLAAIRARSRISEAAALTDRSGLGAFRVMEWVG